MTLGEMMEFLSTEYSTHGSRSLAWIQMLEDYHGRRRLASLGIDLL